MVDDLAEVVYCFFNDTLTVKGVSTTRVCREMASA
jgi:hypothetical protein